jgi:hypothetical protein
MQLPPLDDAETAVPPNAHERQYGYGWECDTGYERRVGGCNARDD